MCLTDKEKRMITSPLSLSARQKRNTKYRIKKKIHKLLHDMQFVLENHKTLSEEFRIDVLHNDDLNCFSTFTNDVDSKGTSDSKDSTDPDLL